MAGVKVSVSVAEGNDFPEVVRSLEDAGFEVEHRLEAVGVVTGVVAEGAVDRLGEIEGVSAVEKLREVRTPPPESEVQ